MFSVDTLAAQPVAVTGDVTAVSGEVATLEVDRWYAGGDADLVTVTSTQGGAALGGVDLVVGEDYLITAADGVLSSCGCSRPASPELAASVCRADGRAERCRPRSAGAAPRPCSVREPATRPSRPPACGVRGTRRCGGGLPSSRVGTCAPTTGSSSRAPAAGCPRPPDEVVAAVLERVHRP